MADRAAMLEVLPLVAYSLRERFRVQTEQLEIERVRRFWQPLKHQEVPQGDWWMWLLLGGRGSGKTDALSTYMNQHVLGPPCIPRFPGGHRPAIIAPTLGDAVESCVNGVSGLKAHNPGVRLVQATGGTYVRWPNGVEAKLFGAFTGEDVERLRAGGNRCVVWAEELAAWVRLGEALDHMTFGLRLGTRPHVVASTTPKPKKRLKDLVLDPRVVVRHATTDDNPYLDPRVRADLYERYGRTHLGRQELGGELIDDVEGALWSRALLERNRVAAAPDLVRIVVAIDPSGGRSEGHAECGIVAAGKGIGGHGFVLRDVSEHLSPEQWARRAIQLYYELGADRILAEKNFGGEMVEYTIRSVDPMVPVKLVSASRGKRVRAEPVAALDEQGKIHHVGSLPTLEDQLVTWVPDSGDPSPDRLDARVWAITELLLGGSEVKFY